MRWIENGWVTADRVVGGSERKELYKDIKSNFPLNAAGEVDWDAPLPKHEPVAGGSAKETNSISENTKPKE